MQNQIPRRRRGHARDEAGPSRVREGRADPGRDAGRFSRTRLRARPGTSARAAGRRTGRPLRAKADGEGRDDDAQSAQAQGRGLRG